MNQFIASSQAPLKIRRNTSIKEKALQTHKHTADSAN
jgi:hypothetical protein